MREAADDEHRGDEGFGMVEVMVSMMLFAVLMLGTLFLIVTAISTSARNSTIESATQWALERADWAHTAVAGLDSTKACPKWIDVRTSPVPSNREDGRGKEMRMLVTASATPATCLTSASAPIVSYTVTVVDAADASKVLAKTTTRIALGLE